MRVKSRLRAVLKRLVDGAYMGNVYDGDVFVADYWFAGKPSKAELAEALASTEKRIDAQRVAV